MNRSKAVEFLINHPAKFGKMVGFTKLTEMHNEWIRSMVSGHDDYTLQAHRGSYKTTCVSVALALICILLPSKHTIFVRKTDTDVKEIIAQVKKILRDDHTRYFVQCIYGVDLSVKVDTAFEVVTNLNVGMSGTPQLLGMGTKGSITGKHYDRIFTDDIVNVDDRVSKAERDKTKLFYQELQNVKNADGRIINTGTPWHKDDCFSIMPEAEKYDVYETGILSDDEIKERKSKMSPSLFACNYELRHIASENVIFKDYELGADAEMCEQGIMQLDSAFYGEDYTAWSIMQIHDGKFYVYGKMRRKHVEECYDEIVNDYERFMCKKMYNEDNADKGMVAKELRQKGCKVVVYHESMNKYVKIVTYLKAVWDDIIFIDGTDKEYIDQICDYSENAEHDDAPDSLASLARVMYKKKSRADEYKPLWN